MPWARDDHRRRAGLLCQRVDGVCKSSLHPSDLGRQTSQAVLRVRSERRRCSRSWSSCTRDDRRLKSPTPTKVQRGADVRRLTFCQTTNAARARYIRVPAVLLSKDKRCLFLCVACMHRRAQQCPTMPRHVELLVYCFSPFQTRRLGECHPLDTPARVGFTKTPLSDA